MFLSISGRSFARCSGVNENFQSNSASTVSVIVGPSVRRLVHPPLFSKPPAARRSTPSAPLFSRRAAARAWSLHRAGNCNPPCRPAAAGCCFPFTSPRLLCTYWSICVRQATSKPSVAPSAAVCKPAGPLRRETSDPHRILRLQRDDSRGLFAARARSWPKRNSETPRSISSGSPGLLERFRPAVVLLSSASAGFSFTVSCQCAHCIGSKMARTSSSGAFACRLKQKRRLHVVVVFPDFSRKSCVIPFTEPLREGL